jgi:hypothetical protein
MTGAELENLVRTRAGGRCEYCRWPESLSDLTFHVDHVVAQKHGGRTADFNLALACVHCNIHKGTDLTGIDPVTGRVVRLFDPRTQEWSEHFGWAGAALTGLTDVGRTTIRVLQMNHPDFLGLRSALMAEGVFHETPS